jgi:hypothetical protein
MDLMDLGYRLRGQSNPTHHHVVFQGFRPGALVQSAAYHFPSTSDLPSSPIFVPRPGGVAGGGDGWVVVPVLSDDGFRVEVFDAADVGGGPVATLAPPRPLPMPFLLHAIWMPEAVTAPEVERFRFADDLGAPAS